MRTTVNRLSAKRLLNQALCGLLLTGMASAASAASTRFGASHCDAGKPDTGLSSERRTSGCSARRRPLCGWIALIFFMNQYYQNKSCLNLISLVFKIKTI